MTGGIFVGGVLALGTAVATSAWALWRGRTGRDAGARARRLSDAGVLAGAAAVLGWGVVRQLRLGAADGAGIGLEGRTGQDPFELGPIWLLVVGAAVAVPLLIAGRVLGRRLAGAEPGDGATSGAPGEEGDGGVPRGQRDGPHGPRAPEGAGPVAWERGADEASAGDGRARGRGARRAPPARRRRGPKAGRPRG